MDHTQCFEELKDAVFGVSKKLKVEVDPNQRALSISRNTGVSFIPYSTTMYGGNGTD
jgi:hypothetical protein